MSGLRQTAQDVIAALEHHEHWQPTMPAHLIGILQSAIAEDERRNAPDLLEAVKLAVSAIASIDEGELGWGEDSSGRWPIRDEVLTNLRAVIAKAEGK